MIVIRPPAAASFAPGQLVASVKIIRLILDPDKNFVMPILQIVDAEGIPVRGLDRAMPNFDAAAQKAYLATAALAGETLTMWAERALLPHLKSVYGLSGTIVPS